MQLEYLYTHEEKVARFGKGIWTDEPDLALWVHQPSGLPCLVKRSPNGSFCGYAGVPSNHPWYRCVREAAAHRLRIHGGVTWACEGRELIAVVVTDPRAEPAIHSPLREGPFGDHWFFGFDTGHAEMDFIPTLQISLAGMLPEYSANKPILLASRHKHSLFGPTLYADFVWVRQETERLAEQLEGLPLE